MSWIELSLQPFSIRSSGSLKGCIPKSNLSAPVADLFLAFSSPAFACFRARESAKVFTSNCASPDSFSLSLESSPLPKHRFQPLVVRLIQLKNKGQLAFFQANLLEFFSFTLPIFLLLSEPPIAVLFKAVSEKMPSMAIGEYGPANSS
ncbi:hypothetical protein CXB51_005449 [Gossypium anomalum]|uniref:Uncharacterized protein n=1 Tax=Gossypium anomalum TaxID=47600 RepID=A0A8J5ZDT2_9ROSI|nr:hypothetical protein CXB51_005449 [Gossypium anomalum]